MLRIWNVCLVITTFLLTLFGTFMTRSGVVQSVHSFGDNPELARLFTIFMIGTAIVSFGFVIYRLPLLRARNELDSWVSREAAFLLNNWILLFCAFFVIFATMFPTLSEAYTQWRYGEAQRITVGALTSAWIDPSWVYGVFAGIVVGYMFYDLTHYYIHHAKPKNRVMLALRSHHNKHHHNARYADKKFGVSCTLWDHVFGTYE